MLADEAVLYADGGGKAAAATVPVRTANHIARFLTGIASKAPADFRVEYVSVNGGEPAAVLWAGAELITVMMFEFSGETIREIYVVRNPDKLTDFGNFQSAVA
jgi:RNA polymerase sigma-70 factor (ECF subfamily)